MYIYNIYPQYKKGHPKKAYIGKVCVCMDLYVVEEWERRWLSTQSHIYYRKVGPLCYL
jgi:hypothetical protein